MRSSFVGLVLPLAAAFAAAQAPSVTPTTAGANGARPQSASEQAATEAGERVPSDATVIVVDGESISAERYGEWLLRSQGTALAPDWSDSTVHAAVPASPGMGGASPKAEASCPVRIAIIIACKNV